jgi:hypothetical protein
MRRNSKAAGFEAICPAAADRLTDASSSASALMMRALFANDFGRHGHDLLHRLGQFYILHLEALHLQTSTRRSLRACCRPTD